MHLPGPSLPARGREYSRSEKLTILRLRCSTKEIRYIAERKGTFSHERVPMLWRTQGTFCSIALDLRDKEKIGVEWCSEDLNTIPRNARVEGSFECSCIHTGRKKAEWRRVCTGEGVMEWNGVYNDFTCLSYFNTHIDL